MQRALHRRRLSEAISHLPPIIQKTSETLLCHGALRDASCWDYMSSVGLWAREPGGTLWLTALTCDGHRRTERQTDREADMATGGGEAWVEERGCSVLLVMLPLAALSFTVLEELPRMH